MNKRAEKISNILLIGSSAYCAILFLYGLFNHGPVLHYNLLQIAVAGALLAVMTAGAYGAVQAGTYNTRALVPEVLVNGANWAVVRPRLEVDQLIALDRMPDWL